MTNWDDVNFVAIHRHKSGKYINWLMKNDEDFTKEKIMELIKNWNEKNEESKYEICEDPLVVDICRNIKIHEDSMRGAVTNDIDGNISLIEDAINSLEDAKDYLERIKRNKERKLK